MPLNIFPEVVHMIDRGLSVHSSNGGATVAKSSEAGGSNPPGRTSRLRPVVGSGRLFPNRGCLCPATGAGGLGGAGRLSPYETGITLWNVELRKETANRAKPRRWLMVAVEYMAARVRRA